MIKQIKRQNLRERLPDEKWTNEFEKAAIVSRENTKINKFGRERSDEMKPEWIEKRKTSDFFFRWDRRAEKWKGFSTLGPAPLPWSHGLAVVDWLPFNGSDTKYGTVWVGQALLVPVGVTGSPWLTSAHYLK